MTQAQGVKRKVRDEQPDYQPPAKARRADREKMDAESHYWSEARKLMKEAYRAEGASGGSVKGAMDAFVMETFPEYERDDWMLG